MTQILALHFYLQFVSQEPAGIMNKNTETRDSKGPWD